MPVWLIIGLAILAVIALCLVFSRRILTALVPLLQRSRIGRKVLAKAARIGMAALRKRARAQAEAAGAPLAPGTTDVELMLAQDDSEQGAAARQMLAAMPLAQRRQLDRMLADGDLEQLMGQVGADELPLGRDARRIVARTGASDASRARQKAKQKAKNRAKRKKR